MRTFNIKCTDYSRYETMFSKEENLNLPESVRTINIMYEEGKSGSIQIGKFFYEIERCANDCYLDFNRKQSIESNFGWKSGTESSTKRNKGTKFPTGVDIIHFAYDNGRVTLEVNGIEVLKCLTSHDFGIQITEAEKI